MSIQSEQYTLPYHNLAEGKYERVIILWTRQYSAVYMRLSRNIAREVCAYLREVVSLVRFSQNTVRVYLDLDAHSEPLPVGDSFRGAIFARTNYSEVMCVGRYPASTAVSTVNIRSLSIAQEEPMQTMRNCPGVIKVGLYVYVFGGFTDRGDSSSCEKFNLRSRHWTSLPDMDKPRACFNPLKHNWDIVLACSLYGYCIAMFSLYSETFKVYETKLENLKARFNTCFLQENVLIVLGSNQMARWEIGSNEVETTDIEPSYKRFSCTEVIVKMEKHFGSITTTGI